jgi:hypothetical protein
MEIRVCRGAVAAQLCGAAMRLSSFGSSAPGFHAAAGKMGAAAERRSPVVDRDNPMVYEPVKLCNCNPRR